MSLNDHNRNGKGGLPIEIEDSTEHVTEELPQGHSLMPEPILSEPKGGEVETPATGFATRDGNKASEGLGKKKLALLGCGLLLAIMFFVFTALVGKHPKSVARPQSAQPAQSQTTNKPKGSVTPLMDAVHQASSDDSSGQLSPGDINRNRSTDGRMQTPKTNVAPKSTMQQTPLSTSLGNVPSFSDTQQKWEEPRPYGEASASPVQTQQQQNSLKEPSLVFVRSQTQPPLSTSTKASEVGDEAPFLDVTPGSRIMAKLEAQISSADPTDVVAVVEYTYAIGDQVVVPAGARVLGKIQQVDRNGYVGVKFDEIQLLGHPPEKIDAVGKGLDLGPIKGIVTGTNAGKNLVVRSISGIGSVLAQVAGNNNSGAFSESDLLRQRLAENIGTAGDSELMTLNANSRIVVSVPADTKIYIVFNKHEQPQPTLHKVSSTIP
jgi:hypothetical protein